MLQVHSCSQLQVVYAKNTFEKCCAGSELTTTQKCALKFARSKVRDCT